MQDRVPGGRWVLRNQLSCPWPRTSQYVFLLLTFVSMFCCGFQQKARASCQASCVSAGISRRLRGYALLTKRWPRGCFVKPYL